MVLFIFRQKRRAHCRKQSGLIYVDSIYRVISIPAYEVQHKLYYNDEEFNNIAELSKWRKYGHK